jgi:hypothetical protein
MPRPRAVTLLALSVWLSAAFNALAVYQGIRRYTTLAALPLSLPPAYLIGSSLVWCLALAALGLGLWRLKTWARRGLLVLGPLYLAQGWLDRLVFGRSDYAASSAPAFLVLHLAAVAVVWAVLLHPAIRQRFSA